MRILILSLFWVGFSNANQVDKPKVLKLKDGPAKTILKKNYRIYLARNLMLEAEKEVEQEIKHGSRSRTGK